MVFRIEINEVQYSKIQNIEQKKRKIEKLKKIRMYTNGQNT